MSLSATLGRYRLGQRIGEGGVGEVFEAELEGAEGFTRKVAIKRLRADLSKMQDLSSQLVDEARLAKRLTHGGIVQVLDVGIDNGRPFLVTELVEGVSLAELAEPSLAVSLFIVEAVADALAHAHNLTSDSGQPTPIIHRDVKPANILVSRDGVVKLADFGIGKALSLPSATAPGMIKGTFGYLSLEQARGSKVDERSDQFSLGVVLYELLAGDNPLRQATSIGHYLEQLEEGLPRLDGVDSELADIVGQATAVDPASRFESIEELREALVAYRIKAKIKARADQVKDAARAATRERPGGLRAALGAELGIGSAATEAAPSAAPRPAKGGIAIYVGATLIAIATIVLAFRFLAGDKPSAPPPLDASLSAAIDAAPSTDGTSSNIDSTDAGSTRMSPDASPVDSGPVDAGPSSANGPKAPTNVPATKGKLKVNLLPWANVTIGRKTYGQTPLTISLAPGTYRVELHNSNRRKSVRVKITAGEQTLITSW